MKKYYAINDKEFTLIDGQNDCHNVRKKKLCNATSSINTIKKYNKNYHYLCMLCLMLENYIYFTLNENLHIINKNKLI